MADPSQYIDIDFVRNYRFTPTDPSAYNFRSPPECPLYTPVITDASNPLEYIEKIKPQAEQYGIIRIRPPQEWQPPFAVDMDIFTFNPRIQKLNVVEARSRIKNIFNERIKRFWELQGFRFVHPHTCGRPIDLHALYYCVKERGGFEVCQWESKWMEICNVMHINPLRRYQLAAHYQNILYPYEVFETRKSEKKSSKAGTGMEKKPVSGNSNQLPSKKQSPNAGAGTEKKPVVVNCNQMRQKAKKSFPSCRSKPTTSNHLNLSPPKKNPYFKSRTTPEKTAHLITPNNAVTKANRNPFKRIKGSTENSRKTIKKEQMDQDPLAKYICRNCNNGDAEESMLLCDGCDDSYHTFCLSPPLPGVPKGDWKCPSCFEIEFNLPQESFGFETSEEERTLDDFMKRADKFKIRNYLQRFTDERAFEQEYWRVVSNFYSPAVAEYGADIYANGLSGFPSHRYQCEHYDPATPKYLKSLWNLNNLPVLRQSLLTYMKEEIPGVNVPWMYVGMSCSTFCWHTEDQWSYSINYLHWGEAKTWYGVPGAYADAFEAVLREAFPELFDEQPDLLHHLTTMVNPNVLMAAGIPVFRTDQKAGDFVVTFPRAYHAGFNQGYNFAEAVNFTPLDWLPIGRQCIYHYSAIKRQNVFSQDELIVRIACMVNKIDPITAAAVHNDFVDMVKEEANNRQAVMNWGVMIVEKYVFETLPDDVRQCSYCKTTLYLSAITCKCVGLHNKMVCIRHYKELCDCPASSHSLRYRWDMRSLPVLCNGLRERALNSKNFNLKAFFRLESLEFHKSLQNL